MPVARTDDDGSGYQVPPVELPTGPDGDFRLLDVGEIYERVMLEDDASIRAAGDSWDAVGQRFLDLAADLRLQMGTVAESWRADSATALAERVESAAVSLETRGAMATTRGLELRDLAECIRLYKIVLAGIWRDFVAETGRLLTPPPDLTLEQRQQWRAETADAPALEVTIRTYSQRALVEVVNPLANRYAEAALTFAAPGPRYGGPTNAARPSDRALLALQMGDWPPDLSSVPGAPGAPSALRTPQAPPVPATPAPAVPPALAAALAVAAPPAPGLPTGAVRAGPSVPVRAPVPAPAPALPRLPSPVVLPPGVTLTGRRPPPVPAPSTSVSAPRVAVLGPPSAPSAPGVPTGARPPSLLGRFGPTSAPGTGHHGSAAPYLPPLPGRRPPGAPVTHLPGRTGGPATSVEPPSGPSPSLPGSGQRRGEPSDAPARPVLGTARSAQGPGAPTGPHLLGRTAPELPAQPPPPPALGGPRSTGRSAEQRTRSGDAGSAGRRRDGGNRAADHQGGVHPALRPGRPASAEPDPQLGSRVGPSHARTAGAALRTSTPPALGTRPERGPQPTPEPGGGRSGELAGRAGATDTTPPTAADQRAAHRARRRAAWEEERRHHRSAPSVSP